MSRPETGIRHGFSQVLQGIYQEAILHDTPKSVVDDDIYIFLNHKFERTSPTDCPGEQAIKHLVQKAAGLFIWAATAIDLYTRVDHFMKKDSILYSKAMPILVDR